MLRFYSVRTVYGMRQHGASETSGIRTPLPSAPAEVDEPVQNRCGLEVTSIRRVPPCASLPTCWTASVGRSTKQERRTKRHRLTVSHRHRHRRAALERGHDAQKSEVAMRGHVTKKGDRYYVVIYEGVDPATTKKRYRWHLAGSTRGKPTVS